jgi:hypothetical protein
MIVGLLDQCPPRGGDGRHVDCLKSAASFAISVMTPGDIATRHCLRFGGDTELHFSQPC